MFLYPLAYTTVLRLKHVDINNTLEKRKNLLVILVIVTLYFWQEKKASIEHFTIHSLSKIVKESKDPINIKTKFS